VALVQLVDHRRVRQRPEVDEHDRRLVLVEHGLEAVQLHSGGDQLEVRILRDERLQPDRNEVLELGRDDRDAGRHARQCT
jgi:hypothetical protein